MQNKIKKYKQQQFFDIFNLKQYPKKNYQQYRSNNFGMKISKFNIKMVNCQICSLQQQVYTYSTSFTCNICQHYNQINPQHGSFICSRCLQFMVYKFFISSKVQCPYCLTVNIVQKFPPNYKEVRQQFPRCKSSDGRLNNLFCYNQDYRPIMIKKGMQSKMENKVIKKRQQDNSQFNRLYQSNQNNYAANSQHLNYNIDSQQVQSKHYEINLKDHEDNSLIKKVEKIKKKKQLLKNYQLQQQSVITKVNAKQIQTKPFFINKREQNNQ